LRRIVVALVASLSASCLLSAAALAAPQGGSGRITLAGHIGSLLFDSSTEADVVAFAGQPTATATRNFGAIPRDPDAHEMGYVCREHFSRGLMYIDKFDYCRTVFYINTWTQQLDAFYSSSSQYSFRSASPGMSTLTAERHIGRRARGGCLTGFSLGWRHGPASFFGEVAGGRAGKHNTIVDGRLTSLALESNRYPVGLLFC
jgi:hypothetical protein